MPVAEGEEDVAQFFVSQEEVAHLICYSASEQVGYILVGEEGDCISAFPEEYRKEGVGGYGSFAAVPPIQLIVWFAHHN